jgi:outer membrane protein assembly factor BamB
MKPTMLVLGLLCISGLALGQDWTQWRGSQRNGIASGAPSLADSWGTNGPTKVWESEPIPAAENGGFSSVTVAGGRAYLFVNWKYHEPIPTRKLTQQALHQLGWFSEKLPEDLVAAMEAARVSDELAALKGPEAAGWIDRWVAEHVPEDQKKTVAPIVSARLKRGRAAYPLPALAKLEEIMDKEFPAQQLFDEWIGSSGLSNDVKAAVVKLVPTTRPLAKDVILCLNANGKTVWKKEYPGRVSGWGSSSTVCLTDGRCYVAGDKTLYCLDAADGREIWKQTLPSGEVSSSPVVIDGVVVVLAGAICGFNAADGASMWTLKEFTGNNPSPAIWQKDGTNYALCNSAKGVACVEPRSGRVLWSAPAGGNGTAAVDGDVMVVLSDRKEVGLAAYRLSPEKAEKTWSHEVTDRGTTPILHSGSVYVIGAGRAACWSVEDGASRWEQKIGGEITSPILADEKILVTTGGALLMIQATPEKYTRLSQMKVDAAICSSPSFADGKIYLRLRNSVVCYDLTGKS